jgi:hypothetical protein
VTNEEAEVVVEAMTAISFFPSAPAAQALVARELTKMCPNLDDGMWLAGRAARLYSGEKSWARCGINGLWQIWFSKHRPKNEEEQALDLLCGSTDSFPEGVPSERALPMLESPHFKALPRGIPVSSDPALDNLVTEIAAALAPETRTAEDVGKLAKAAHPELAALDDKYVGLKVLAKEKRDEKRVDAELRAICHMPPAEASK